MLDVTVCRCNSPCFLFSRIGRWTSVPTCPGGSGIAWLNNVWFTPDLPWPSMIFPPLQNSSTLDMSFFLLAKRQKNASSKTHLPEAPHRSATSRFSHRATHGHPQKNEICSRNDILLDHGSPVFFQVCRTLLSMTGVHPRSHRGNTGPRPSTWIAKLD